MWNSKRTVLFLYASLCAATAASVGAQSPDPLPSEAMRKWVEPMKAALKPVQERSTRTLVATKAGAKTVTVKCDKGKTITDALETKADELTIEVRGFCNENVLIRRDHVTLTGRSPAQDGVNGVVLSADDPFSSAVTIREGRHIRIENLALTGSADGLRVENSRRNISAENLVLTGTRFGAVTVGGNVSMENISVSGAGTAGFASAEAGRLTCTSCTLTDNPSTASGFGVIATTGAVLTLRDSVVSGSRFSVVADSNAKVFISTSTLSGDGLFGLIVDDYASVTLDESDFDGGFFVDGKSSLFLAGTVQTASGSINTVGRDSFLTMGSRRLDDGTIRESSLAVDLFLDTFSEGQILASSSLQNISCSSGSDLFCGPSVIKTGSSCGLCP